MKMNTSSDLSEKSAKELKAIADVKGIEYNSNASQAQMLELLKEKDNQDGVEENSTEMIDVQSDNISPNSETVDLQSLLREINDLKKLVNITGDVNKIKDYERSKNKLNNFAFSIKLYVDDQGIEYPIINWKTIKNYVAEEGRKVDQVIEITYLNKGEEVNLQIPLVEFTRTLKRTEPLLATKIQNEDGTNVYISKSSNPETKLEYYVMRPESDIINITFDYNGQEISILSTYLNA